MKRGGNIGQEICIHILVTLVVAQRVVDHTQVRSRMRANYREQKLGNGGWASFSLIQSRSIYFHTLVNGTKQKGDT